MTAGWSAEEARNAVRLTVSLGRDVSIQIAKVRAIRLAWGMLWTALGASPREVRCHGRTAWRTQTVYDIENNQVRATLEALAGVVGGCSSLSLRRFDGARSARGEFSTAAARLTLATQSILAEECGLKRVVDAASGSACLETMTEQIARRGWQYFRSVEISGGAESRPGIEALVASLRLASTQRHEALAAGLLPIVGVSAFPAASERLPSELEGIDLSGDSSSVQTGRWRDSGPQEEERRGREIASSEEPSDRSSSGPTRGNS
jgi:methylmalonyl-CoA mutase